jgi:hypothetical protein
MLLGECCGLPSRGTGYSITLPYYVCIMYMTHSERMYRISLHDCVCRVIRMVPKIVLLLPSAVSHITRNKKDYFRCCAVASY